MSDRQSKAAEGRIYVVTGANGGLGCEAARQLAALPSTSRVYLACRDAAKADAAVHRIIDTFPAEERNAKKEILRTIQFDTSDRGSVDAAVGAISDDHIHGVLLNAGGFTSDKKGTKVASGATLIAETNLIGHAAFVNGLVENGKIRAGTRVIFAGSEGALEVKDWKGSEKLDFFVGHLNGTNQGVYFAPTAYCYVKAIMALYASALARNNPGVYVATVSPGSTSGTGLYGQGALGPALGFVVQGYARMMQRHSVDAGAERYVHGITGQKDWDTNHPSASFVVSAKKYTGPVCNVADRCKRGSLFSDETKQDLAYEAVGHFL